MHSTKISACSLVLAACACCVTAADADVVTPEEMSVLLYYDGSPQLHESYQTALNSFAQHPDYLAPFETSDASEFEIAISEETYDVFVAVTVNSATADAWLTLAKGGSVNFASILPNDSGGHTIRSLIQPDSTEIAPPPPGEAISIAPLGSSPKVAVNMAV